MVVETELIMAVSVILACALAVLFIGRQFNLPMIIGYFLTGIIVGPSLLGLVTDEQVSLLAELGVILLMFTIGLEMSLKNLLAMRKKILVTGGLQLVLTTVSVIAIMIHLGFEFNVAILTGFMVAPSSTAIIMNLYQQKGEINSVHGKTSLGILIFQDISVIPMMLLVPIIAGTSSGNITMEILNLIFGMILLCIILVAAIFLVPRLLNKVAEIRSSELFIITIVVICFGIAWLMSLNGVSLALGAFLAGIAISESEYSHEVVGQIMPIRDILTSFFFVSIGMMLSLSFLSDHLLAVILLAIAVIIGKGLINYVSIKAIGVASGAAFLSAAGVSQIGEFSFILGSTGISTGIITGDFYQIFLAVSIITMAMTPLIVDSAPGITHRIFKNTLFSAGKGTLFSAKNAISRKENSRLQAEESLKSAGETTDDNLKDHIIIVGFGVVGQHVAKACRSIGINYVIVELNPETIKSQREKGERIIYGDARHESVLEHSKIKTAKAIILTIPDTAAVKAVITTIRMKNPKVGIITRSRFISEIAELYRLGADEVIVDEREAAIQIFRRILANEQVPQQDLDQYVRQIRCELYDQYFEKKVLPNINCDPKPGLFGHFSSRLKAADEKLPKRRNSVEQIHVGRNSQVCEKNLGELMLRANYGVSVIAIRRGAAEKDEIAPQKNTVLKEGDTAVVIGDRASIARIIPLFIEKDEKSK